MKWSFSAAAAVAPNFSITPLPGRRAVAGRLMCGMYACRRLDHLSFFSGCAIDDTKNTPKRRE